jgi:hypothetical protein
MGDLVRRLRNADDATAYSTRTKLLQEAADEIERLRAVATNPTAPPSVEEGARRRMAELAELLDLEAETVPTNPRK